MDLENKMELITTFLKWSSWCNFKIIKLQINLFNHKNLLKIKSSKSKHQHNKIYNNNFHYRINNFNKDNWHNNYLKSKENKFNLHLKSKNSQQQVAIPHKAFLSQHQQQHYRQEIFIINSQFQVNLQKAKNLVSLNCNNNKIRKHQNLSQNKMGVIQLNN